MTHLQQASARRVRRVALLVLLACLCVALLWSGRGENHAVRVAMAADEPAEAIEGGIPIAPAAADPHGAAGGASVGETPIATGTVEPQPDGAPADVAEVPPVAEAAPPAIEEQAASVEEAAAPVEEMKAEAPVAANDPHDEEVMDMFDARAEFRDEEEAERAAAAAAAAAAADVVIPSTPTDTASVKDASQDLDSLTEEELKKILSDKKNGQVNFKHYKGREELVAAIRVEEKKEAARRAFRDEVAAAARWYAEQQEERKYQKANARRFKASRIKHAGDLPPALQSHESEGEGETVHEIRIVYNEANGYGARFAAMQKDLEDSEVKLPNLSAFRFVGEPYQMSTNRILIGKGLQACFFGTLAAAVVPDMVPFLPEAVRNIMRTRRGLVLSTAFLFNVLSSSALQNGAFEVYLDNEVIYSTIKLNGRLPTSEMVSTLILERTLLKDYNAAMSAKAAK